MSRTLLYKRTHCGDPDERGWFGCNGCMGSIRCREFDNVIGIGGLGKEPEAYGIDGKVNWIGLGAHKTKVPGDPCPVITFDHFLYCEPDGPDFRWVARQLAKRMYDNGARQMMNFSAAEQLEIDRLLALATDSPPSKQLPGQRAVTKKKICRKRHRSTHC